MTHESHVLPPMTSQSHAHLHPSSAENFPIIAVVIIGMFSTSLFLLSYYIFVIKCCLDQRHGGFVRRFSRSRQTEDPSSTSSSPSQPRGLGEAAIRLIPVIRYKNKEGGREFGERGSCECAVCLNEFQEDEKLRVIPNCSHIFHIDCIDVWLQNNANCPLCRRRIFFTSQTIHLDHILITPRPSPQDQSQNNDNFEGNEDFVVVNLENELDSRDQNFQGNSITSPNSPSQMNLEDRIVDKKGKKLHKVTSMGDECVGIDRVKNDQFFSFQPIIRRSFSMDSLVDRKFYLSVQQALQQPKRHVHEVRSIEVCNGSGRAKRSCFSFGHGSRSRSSVLPVYLDP